MNEQKKYCFCGDELQDHPIICPICEKNVRKGIEARRAGRTKPLSQVEKELGLD